MSGFSITKAHQDDALVLSIAGDLDLVAARELRRACEELTHTTVEEVVIDLSQVVFIDSHGLSSLLAGTSRLNDRSVRLVVSHHLQPQRFIALAETFGVELGFDLTAALPREAIGE